MNQGNFAFVTLATDDSYAKGALVLAESLKIVNTTAKLVVLVTAEISSDFRNRLTKTFDLVEEVSPIDSQDAENLALLERPELGVTITKIHCWNLTQFTKCVFLDADTLVLKNCDELFDRTELSAVPDIGWPDCFNSGVFVYQPSEKTFKELRNMASNQGSFDGGDQGLLNSFFSDWGTRDISKHLSFIYNMNISASYSYLPAYKRFGKDVKIVHFLGSQKPWMYDYNKDKKAVDSLVESYPLTDYLNHWWNLFTEHMAQEDVIVTQISQNLTNLNFSPETTSKVSSPSPVVEEENRLYSWEQGRIDYMGRDSYDNIERKLDEAINGSKKI